MSALYHSDLGMTGIEGTYAGRLQANLLQSGSEHLEVTGVGILRRKCHQKRTNVLEITDTCYGTSQLRLNLVPHAYEPLEVEL